MRLAPIERLPVELLQQIYIDSGYALALLESSPYIATRLSSEYIFNGTCDYYLTEVHGGRQKQSAAQSIIFASKWMTWSFFKSWCLRRFERQGCLCDRNSSEGCFDAQWPPNFKDATKMVFSRSHLPRLAFVKGRIPKKLLCAPWSQDKIEFLRFLLWITSMSVDWHDPETAKIAVEGRRQAMIERNLEAVELFNHNRRLGNFSSLETVHVAVTEAGCDRSIVYDTLLTLYPRNRHTDYRYYNILHQWCDDQEAMGNRKGTWLRKKLDESLVISNDDGAKRFQRMTVSPRKTRLNIWTADYYDKSDDVLTTNELEWNKVCFFFVLSLIPIPAFLETKHYPITPS